MTGQNGKRAIVTGASGFLGSHTVERLLADGFHVRALDMDEDRFARRLRTAAGDRRLSFAQCDILDVEPGDRLFADAAYLFHCAGIADHVPSMKEPERYLKAHVMAVARVLEAARHHRYAKVVYPSSASVYGIAEWPTSENHPIHPVNVYGLTKWMGEELIAAWSRMLGVPALSFRIFNGYGPRAETGSAINFFIKKKFADEPIRIYGSGSQKRDFIYISDIVEAFVRGALSDCSSGVYNLGTGQLHTVLEVARLISDNIEFGPERPGEPPVICPDTTRIVRDFDWQPVVTLEEGVGKTLAFYLESGA